MLNRLEDASLSTLEIYDYIIITASLLSILLCCIYLIMKPKRNLHTYMLIILLLCLFVATLLFALSVLATISDSWCKMVAGLSHFFYTASVFWSSSIAINIYRVISTVTAVKDSGTNTLGLYGVYAFGIPIIVTSAAGIADMTGVSDQPVYRTSAACFLNSSNVPYIFGLFLIPIYAGSGISILLGCLCMARVLKSPAILSTDKHRKKRNALTCVKLALALGFTWVLFPFILIGPSDSRAAIMYGKFVMCILELQGCLVVMATVVTWKGLTRCSSLTRTFLHQGERSSHNPSSSQEMTQLTKASQVKPT